MLSIEKLNYRRQCCSMASMAFTLTLFVLFTLSQSGLMKWLGGGRSNFWITCDFVSVIFAMLSLVCGMLLIFYIEREKRDINKKLEHARRLGKYRGGLKELKEKKGTLDKISDFIERNANKIDFLGTLGNTLLQLTALTFLFLNGVSLSSSVKVGDLGVTHCVDLFTNTAFFMTATLFAISHCIIHRNEKSFSKNLSSQTKLMCLMFAGNLLVWGGKIVCALESIGKIPTIYLPNGGTLPLGWLARTVGIILCAVSMCMIMANTSRNCDELTRIVESGEHADEVVSRLSTHDVRSCFGYMEHGL
uniref:hypothetical protein n=1 Tax=Anaplasma phagocytophilum TaxID=948 RepID=UPI0018AD3C97|nr:hypothetical protein [Anaplasma phagocytophilum]